MSLKSKIEAVIYASEEPVTLAQLVVLLSEEAQAELNALAALQSQLPLDAVPDPAANETSDADAAIPQSDPGPIAAHTMMESDPTGDDTDQTAPETTEQTPEAEESAGPSEIEGTGAQEPLQDLASGGDQADAPEAALSSSPEAEKRQVRERERAIRDYLRGIVDALIREYAEFDRGLEIREVAGGFRFGTKPEYHDAVRGFVKSLKPALKLSLQALETLAVVAYKQPVTAAEISEIRGVDSAGVLGGLLTRKLIQTAGRKQVIGRPMLYKTTKEFLVRFGLRDVQELPSMEEFERMAGELAEQEDLPMDATDSVIERANARGDAEHIRDTNEASAESSAASPAEEAGQPAGNGLDLASADEDGPDNSPGPEGANVSANVESSPRSEAEPAGAEQEQV